MRSILYTLLAGLYTQLALQVATTAFCSYNSDFSGIALFMYFYDCHSI